MKLFKHIYYLTTIFILLISPLAYAQEKMQLANDSLQVLSIAGIKIKGNDKTKDVIIERELSFTINEELSLRELDKRIKETHKNLIKLSLFNYVTIEKEFLPYQQVGITIIVEERWFLWPQLSMINNDRNFNSWWETRDFAKLDYRIAIKQCNVLGLNHTLKVGLSYGYTREISISYNNISLGIEQKHFFDFNVHFFRQNSSFYQSVNNKIETFTVDDEDVINGYTAMINYTFRPKHKSTHGMTISYNSIEIADTLFQIRPDFLSENQSINKYLQLSYHYNFDSRDDKSYPLTGNRIQLSVVKRGLGLNEEYPVNLTYFYSNISQFYKIINRLYGAHSLSVKKSLENSQPYYYKQGLGHRDYLRGYEYYVIEGEDFYLLKNTLKFELLPKIITNLNFIPIKKFKKIHYSIFLNTYFDIGLSHEKDNEIHLHNNLSNSLLYSGGIGINIVTYYDKVVRFEYSLNSLGETGFFVHFKADI